MSIRQPDRQSDSQPNPRRRFLAATSVVASGSALPSLAGAAIASGQAAKKDGLYAADFRRALNTEFSVVALSAPSAQATSVTLVQVRASGFPHPSLSKANAAEYAFSLKFLAGTAGLAQDTYLVSHPSLGNFAALLVPTADSNSLCAEFHRL